MTYDGHLPVFFDEVFSGVPNAFVGQVPIDSIAALYLTVLRLETTTTFASTICGGGCT